MIGQLLRSRASFWVYFTIILGVLGVHVAMVSLQCRQIHQVESAASLAIEQGRTFEPLEIRLVGGLKVLVPTSKLFVLVSDECKRPEVMWLGSERRSLSYWEVAQHYLVSLCAVLALLGGLLVRDIRQVGIRMVAVVVPLLLYYLIFLPLDLWRR
jgi:hypothetical protein